MPAAGDIGEGGEGGEGGGGAAPSWTRFDDLSVQSVPEDTVLHGDHAQRNSYLLVYVNEAAVLADDA